jgi:hypothetical protein
VRARAQRHTLAIKAFPDVSGLFPGVSIPRRVLDRVHWSMRLLGNDFSKGAEHVMNENDEQKPDPLYSRREAARYLTDQGLVTAAQTLARVFHEGTGPLCTHVKARAMYRKSHLDEYFESQVSEPRRSSSEPRRVCKKPPPDS